MPDDLSEAIKQNAQGPSAATGDTGSFRSQPLKDQIEADRYLRECAHADSGNPLSAIGIANVNGPRKPPTQ